MYISNKPHWRKSHTTLFSTRYGEMVWIPGTSYVLKVYPSIVSMWNVYPHGDGSESASCNKILNLNERGPYREFVLKLDCMTRKLYVSSKTFDGKRIAYVVSIIEGVLLLQYKGKKHEIVRMKELDYGVEPSCGFPLLNLGVHKHCYLDRIMFRGDPREILPLCFNVAKYIPCEIWEEHKKTIDCFKWIMEGSKDEIIRKICTLWLSSSFGLYVFTGINRTGGNETTALSNGEECPMLAMSNSLSILYCLSKATERLFYHKVSECHVVLDVDNIPELTSGKIHHIEMGHGEVVLEISWRKKKISRIKIEFKSMQDIKIGLSKAVSCRLTKHRSKANIDIVNGSLDVDSAAGIVILDQFGYGACRI